MRPAAIIVALAIEACSRSALALVPWNHPGADAYGQGCDATAFASLEAAGVPAEPLKHLRNQHDRGEGGSVRQIRSGEVLDYQVSANGHVLHDVIALTALWGPDEDRSAVEYDYDDPAGRRFALVDPGVCRNCSVTIFPPLPPALPATPWWYPGPEFAGAGWLASGPGFFGGEAAPPPSFSGIASGSTIGGAPSSGNILGSSGAGTGGGSPGANETTLFPVGFLPLPASLPLAPAPTPPILVESPTPIGEPPSLADLGGALLLVGGAIALKRWL